MPYTFVDPIEYETRVERARLSGEISNTEAMRRIIENKRAIDQAWDERQAQEKAVRDAADRRRAASKLEDERNAAEKARQKYINDAPERARQAQEWDEYLQRKERAKQAELYDKAERERVRRYKEMRDRPSSSGSNSAPTGQNNPRSADTISGQSPTGYRPSGSSGNNSGNGGGSSRPSGGSPFQSQPVIEKNRPISKPLWGDGGTSGGLATRGPLPTSAPTGTPARPAPFSPNRAPSMGRGLAGGLAGLVGGGILDKIAEEGGKNAGRAIAPFVGEHMPWFVGKQRNPVTGELEPIPDPDWLPDPFRRRKKGEPEPDPNDPFGNPNNPKPGPFSPPRPDYRPGTAGEWDYYQFVRSGEIFPMTLSGTPETQFRVIDDQFSRLYQFNNGDGWIHLFVGNKDGKDGAVILGFRPNDGPDPGLAPRTDPKNRPDPSIPPSPGLDPNNRPAPGREPSPSPSPDGNPAPNGGTLGNAMPSPGGDRAPRPDLKPENEIKPKNQPQPAPEPDRSPGFKPQGNSAPRGTPGGSPSGSAGSAGSETIEKYEPITTGAPSPKPGINPGSDPKTDPRERDKKTFDPSGNGVPSPDPDPLGGGSGGTGTDGPPTPTTCRYKEDETQSTTVKVPVSLFGVARVEQTRTLQVHEKMTEPTALMFDQLLEIRKGIDKIQKTTLIIRVLNTLSTIASIHNMMMLSRNLAQTAGDATSAVINAIGRISGTIDKDQELIDVNTILAKTTDKFFEEMLGEATWKSTKKTWNQYSAIYSSAAMITQTVRGMADSAKSVAEWTANNTGRIGNALKKFGAVGENAYPWMSENVASQSKFDRALGKFKQTGENMEDTFSSVESVASESMSIKDESEELKEQAEKFEKSIKELSPKAATENDVKKAASTTEKAASPGQETTATDLNKVE
jgi:hypothetical protein